MAIYKARLEASVAPENVIQGPNLEDIGADLDNIEKAIEADNDRIEDANAFTDPIEEAYSVMYESEYNFNQLMRCIGIHELREASVGRDLVLSESDRKGFFASVKDIFKKMFAAISNAFVKAINALRRDTGIDKRFIEKNKDKIIEGAKTDWRFENGFKFIDIVANTSMISCADDEYKNAEENLKQLRTGEVGKIEFPNDKENHESIISKVANINAKDIDNIKDLSDALYKKYRTDGEVVVLDKSNTNANDIINVLENNDEKELRKMYGEIKNTYADAISKIDMLEKAINAQEYENVIDNAFSVCGHAISNLRFEKNVQNTIFHCAMKALVDRRQQARKIAVILAKNAKTETKKDDKKEDAPLNDSYNIFNRISII